MSHTLKINVFFYGIYLDSLQIVPCIPQKHHPIPADVLPNDSEALFPTIILLAEVATHFLLLAHRCSLVPVCSLILAALFSFLAG